MLGSYSVLFCRAQILSSEMKLLHKFPPSPRRPPSCLIPSFPLRCSLAVYLRGSRLQYPRLASRARRAANAMPGSLSVCLSVCLSVAFICIPFKLVALSITVKARGWIFTQDIICIRGSAQKSWVALIGKGQLGGRPNPTAKISAPNLNATPPTSPTYTLSEVA